MRKCKGLFFTALLILPFFAIAQKRLSKVNSAVGFTVNVGASSFANAFSWSHYHAIGKSRRINIGYGLRLTNFFGSDLNYITAPAKYTSGKSSIGALFSENILANLDTIAFAKAQVNFLNIGIYLKYILPFAKDRFELGVNIDALGLSLGSRQGGVYGSTAIAAKPSVLNLLLISDSDKGSLNSEWYIGYAVNEKLTVKAGYEFLFTEYTTDSKIQALPNSTDRNDRFRLKSAMIMLGLHYALFKK
jgi:hypothetical protein